MQTVSPEFASAYAQSAIYADAKVTIEFGNNRFNDGQVVTASSTKPINRGVNTAIQSEQTEFWRGEDVYNNKNRNTMKWLVCDAGALLTETEDGTGYRCIDLDDGEYERGWWSETKSDGSGLFGVAEEVVSEFFEQDGITPFVRRINKVSLYTTEGYANMKEVTVSYKDSVSGWTDVATNFVLAENTYLHEWNVVGEANITGLRVRVHSTWEPNDWARISELQGYYIKDVSDDIVSVDIREARQEYEGTVPIGTNAANTLSVELDNTTGQYNIENVDSTYYPYIAANNRVVVELGIKTGTDYFAKAVFPGTSGSYIRTLDNAALDITGDLDLRIKASATDWTSSNQELISKWGSSNSYLLRLRSDGKLQLFWGNGAFVVNGSIVSTAAVGLIDGQAKWIRATLDVDNGAGGHDVKFWLSDDGSIWTQLGSTITTGGTTSIGVGTANVEIGSQQNGTVAIFNGTVYRAEIRNGIDGTVVAAPDFTIQDSGTTSFSDSTGRLWSVLGSVSIQDTTQEAGPIYEYLPYGEFWVDEWSNDGGNTTASFDARDFSKFIQDEASNISRIWLNTNISTVFYDLLARQGYGADRVDIDQNGLRGFEILFLKDSSIWSFMQEVAFADQGVFGFDRNGDFYYHSYNRLNEAPYLTSQYNFSWETNIESGSQRTQLYANKVIVRVSPYSTDTTGRRNIWSVKENTNLTWAKLGAGINAGATTIPVVAATNQSTGNLTLNNWQDKNGYLWFPIQDGDGNVTSGEVVKYKSRSDSSFLECERGYFGTPAVSHTSGAYIGEINVFDVEFDNAPAIQVFPPFIVAIDGLELVEGEGDPQAHVVLWDYNPFGGKLVVGNLVNYYTLLSGQGVTIKDKYDGNSDQQDDVTIDFDTLVGGIVATEKTGGEQIGKDAEYTAENRDFIRRYGKNELQIDNPWIQSKAHAEDIASIIIDEYKNSRDVIQIDGIIYPPVELADRVTITNYPQLDIVNKEYHVIEASITYNGGLVGSYTLREVKP